MAEIGKLWAGQVYGTNTGKLFLDFSSYEATTLKGLLRLSDDQFGLALYTVEGSFIDSVLTLTGTAIDASQGSQLGSLSALATLQSNGIFLGEWKSTTGTAGTFELFPHQGSQPRNPVENAPEQLYTAVRDVGVLRLYRDDVVMLITSLKRKFSGSKIVITHIDRGAQIARFSDDFEAGLNGLDKLKWLRISVQAPAGSGLSRNTTVDLGEAINRVTTQGPDEAWVLGEAEATASYLRRRQRKLSTAIGRYRINIYQVILIGALIAMPDLPIAERAAFIVVAIGLVFLANKIHERLIPNFLANFSRARAGWIDQIGPSIFSWFIAIVGSVVASVVYAVLQKPLGL